VLEHEYVDSKMTFMTVHADEC